MYTDASIQTNKRYYFLPQATKKQLHLIGKAEVFQAASCKTYLPIFKSSSWKYKILLLMKRKIDSETQMWMKMSNFKIAYDEK